MASRPMLQMPHSTFARCRRRALSLTPSLFTATRRAGALRSATPDRDRIGGDTLRAMSVAAGRDSVNGTATLPRS
jgi:hypothetical protein